LDRHGYLAVSDLLNHLYCGRITWFSYVLGVRQRGTVKTEHGREEHEQWLRREEERRRQGAVVRTQRKLVSVEVCSDRLMLRGKMDALIDQTGVVAPYEVKATVAPVRPWPGQVLQLGAYALLLEERYGRPVEHGYLHYLEGDIVREVRIGEPERAAVLEVLAAIQDVVTTEAMPARAPASRCRDCVYRKICV
jgi:CRISPR-associated exonuclease Cas4